MQFLGNHDRGYYQYGAMIIGLLASILSLELYCLFAPSISSPKGAMYTVPAGTSNRAILMDIARKKILLYPRLFLLYAFFHSHSSLKAGEYFFPKRASIAQVCRQLKNGTGLVYYALTIVPGWSFTQLRYALAQAPALRQTITLLDDKAIMQKLGDPTLSPEGEFFPDTYYYTRNTMDRHILYQAFMRMQIKLQYAWQQREQRILPYHSPYQALIAASLIEKEAYLKVEQQLIAGVFVNRLRHNMLLQCDPTVIYGLADHYHGQLYRKQLLQTGNRYNTYQHKGLPPTPIAMPSLSAIHAALHPICHHYLYFVSRGDGSHYFSMTLKEHHLAVMLFQYRQSLLRSRQFSYCLEKKQLSPLLSVSYLSK